MSTDIVTEEQIQQWANELVQANRDLIPIPPLRTRSNTLDLQDAYRVQAEQLRQHVADGRALAGRKIGLTSLAMQQQLGVDAPDFGFFFEDMVHTEGASIPADRFISPKVEPELGFLLNHSLQGPGVTLEQAAEATGEIYAAIEIIDSRIENWDIKLVDTVADNASCGAIAVATTPLEVSAQELKGVECTLHINGEPREFGTGGAVMGDPVAPLAWLANVLGEKDVPLEAGQLVLTGSFTKALPVLTGESATADFGSLGSFTINFS